MSSPPTPKQSARQTLGAKIDGNTNRLAGFIKGEMEAMEKRLLSAVQKPDRLTDRLLHWVAAKRASWLIWPILALTHCLAASVWRALAE